MVRKYDPDYDGIPMLHPNYGRATDYTLEELHNLRAHYCAEAELVDRWVGRIFQKLDDLNLWDSTIVIFTTDHGMSLGEHNRTGKSNINEGDDRRWPLYPEVAHIPFIIAAPRLPQGITVDLLAQPADILPTLIELNGLAVTPPDPFHGRTFARHLQGVAQPPLHDYVISGSFLQKTDGEVPATAVTPVVYTHRWAYAPLGPTGTPELFDLTADPYAETNVLGDHRDIAGEMHDRLIVWLREVGAPEKTLEVYT
jgi:arylsulfatase A-like enzyme